MIQLTPIAIAATSQQYLTNVVENLCQAFCADNGVQPTGIVNFTVAEQQTVNTQTIVTINAAVLPSLHREFHPHSPRFST